MYEKLSDTLYRRLADGAFIPAAPGNSDYEALARWLEAGNQPTQPEKD